MKCKEIQELLLTDFLDGELSSARRAAVDQHLEYCIDCRAYAEEVRKTAVMPFTEAEEVAAPAGVWQAISEAINEEERASLREMLRERLRDFLGTILAPFKMRGPALAFASTCVVVIAVFVAVSLPLRYDLSVGEIMNENMSFLSSLSANGTTDSEMTSDDLDTTIEYFFL
jgi:anti-sigma factor RsiW